jgi:HK97 family phage prohead protease
VSEATTRPPRENLIRAVMPGVELRSESDGDDGLVMAGHFAVFDKWTEINSLWEGNFMERFVSGAFKKTIREQRDRMRVLFQHGTDPQVGDKPLGPIRDLREDDEGAAYEVPLLDASYVRDQVLPGLQAGLYGASFRFKVMREEIVDEPKPSDSNPHGLPERTVKEAQVMEFGPVTFPAYEGASAGIRSLTDDLIMSCIRSNPDRLREMLEQASDIEEQDAPSEDDAEPEQAHLADERRDKHTPTGRVHLYGTRRKEKNQSWRL